MTMEQLLPFDQSSSARRDRADVEYSLIVRQQPKQARMCGVGGKADRRPIDPPPIVQLRVIEHATQGSPSSRASPSSSQSFLQNPYYFMFASLASPDSDEELHLLKDGKTRCTTGSVVSSLYHLKDSENNGQDAGIFVFPDLSVRTEGSYRLKLSLFEVIGINVHHCKSIFSKAFYVYTAKKFPGMEESTQLSCSLADQGIKIRIRKDIRVRKRPVQAPRPHPIPLPMPGLAGSGPSSQQQTLPSSTGPIEILPLDDPSPAPTAHSTPVPASSEHSASAAPVGNNKRAPSPSSRSPLKHANRTSSPPARETKRPRLSGPGDSYQQPPSQPQPHLPPPLPPQRQGGDADDTNEWNESYRRPPPNAGEPYQYHHPQPPLADYRVPPPGQHPTSGAYPSPGHHIQHASHPSHAQHQPHPHPSWQPPPPPQQQQQQQQQQQASQQHDSHTHPHHPHSSSAPPHGHGYPSQHGPHIPTHHYAPGSQPYPTGSGPAQRPGSAAPRYEMGPPYSQPPPQEPHTLRTGYPPNPQAQAQGYQTYGQMPNQAPPHYHPGSYPPPGPGPGAGHHSTSPSRHPPVSSSQSQFQGLPSAANTRPGGYANPPTSAPPPGAPGGYPPAHAEYRQDQYMRPPPLQASGPPPRDGGPPPQHYPHHQVPPYIPPQGYSSQQVGPQYATYGAPPPGSQPPQGYAPPPQSQVSVPGGPYKAATNGPVSWPGPGSVPTAATPVAASGVVQSAPPGAFQAASQPSAYPAHSRHQESSSAGQSPPYARPASGDASNDRADRPGVPSYGALAYPRRGESPGGNRIQLPPLLSGAPSSGGPSSSAQPPPAPPSGAGPGNYYPPPHQPSPSHSPVVPTNPSTSSYGGNTSTMSSYHHSTHHHPPPPASSHSVHHAPHPYSHPHSASQPHPSLNRHSSRTEADSSHLSSTEHPPVPHTQPSAPPQYAHHPPSRPISFSRHAPPSSSASPSSTHARSPMMPRKSSANGTRSHTPGAAAGNSANTGSGTLPGKKNPLSIGSIISDESR